MRRAASCFHPSSPTSPKKILGALPWQKKFQPLTQRTSVATGTDDLCPFQRQLLHDFPRPPGRRSPREVGSYFNFRSNSDARDTYPCHAPYQPTQQQTQPTATLHPATSATSSPLRGALLNTRRRHSASVVSPLRRFRNSVRDANANVVGGYWEQRRLIATKVRSGKKLPVRKELPLGPAADAAIHVMLPVDDAVAQVREHFNSAGGNLALIRGPPSSGKTTLARELLKPVKDGMTFILVSLHECRVYRYTLNEHRFSFANLFVPHTMIESIPIGPHNSRLPLTNFRDYEFDLPETALDLVLAVVKYMRRLDLFTANKGDQAHSPRRGPTEAKWQSAFQAALVRIKKRFRHQWEIQHESKNSPGYTDTDKVRHDTGEPDLFVYFTNKLTHAKAEYCIEFLLETNKEDDYHMSRFDPTKPSRNEDYKVRGRSGCIVMFCNKPTSKCESPSAAHVDFVQIARTDDDDAVISHGLFVNIHRKAKSKAVPKNFPQVMFCNCVAEKLDASSATGLSPAQRVLPFAPQHFFAQWVAELFVDPTSKVVVRSAFTNMKWERAKKKTESDLKESLAEGLAGAKEKALRMKDNKMLDKISDVNRSAFSLCLQ